MRPVSLIAAAALALSAAPAAFGQTTSNQAAPPPPPPQTEQAFSASTKAADLTGINLKIAQDEARMTLIRDAELARENARLRAIKPALPFHGLTFLPNPFL